MKKLLKIEKGRGYFINENDEYVLITELTPENLKNIIEIVFKEKDSHFDTFDESTVHNAADRIIYSKIFTKLKNIEAKREEIVSNISAEFSSLKDKYKLD